ncbi:peptidase G2 autoproteolytic cleavage domain-containing protein [Phaeobacter gallaeciensis]|uniref:peptidase G2 autoproteolytic cleavage domain-containing protein n=1 Tax=Phaeobacter gallaeciensis TaxID=60890 RepID=UPI00237F9A78|nr:peptidase G2 autoproteolytic cleavage domain-containing protein [Phaeobacter gallaeciensis]MDE4142335.1 peptidase G2 autoproteolytic cleavage domain-containing protein [Phaeobacter gallaeciensis]MDE4150695.1 peptidase G2 autoproteolytic cleavage domain-containing protein [Phaeobacter gallaeciensis]MDE4154924.1 peptidase G2 autoproteolytic cleavage domain-containing protein [Phaeobacter gallaeciensis]MDE4230399.1 peptidase G2 autoproteolytic cleavage domain-containing protein [Phaeobacter gal
MSYPEFSDFPPIPQRSAAEADFDTKMSALFRHFATTHRAELIALIDFLKTNSTIIGGALNATTVGLDSPAAGKFTELTVDIDTLHVDSTNDRVGIGDSAPRSRLEVFDGDVELGTSGGREAEYRLLRRDTGSLNGMAAIGMNGAGGNGYLGEIKFYTGQTSDSFNGSLIERMRIDSSGDVGIGVASPTAKVEAEIFADTQIGCLLKATSGSYANSAFRAQVTRAASAAFSFFRGYSSGNGDLGVQIRGDGNAFIDNSWTGGGADYAEYFEWADGNPGHEDRRGLSVVLDGDKIRPALPGEEPIGVISANPSVVGDGDIDRWKGKYLRDAFGAYIWEDYEALSWTEVVTETETIQKQAREAQERTREVIEVVDGVAVKTVVTETVQEPLFDEFPLVDESGAPVLGGNGSQLIHREPCMVEVQEETTKGEKHSYAADEVPDGVTVPADAERVTQQRRKLNPDYDASQEYTPRADRPEWDTVGLMGKLRLLKGQPTSARWIKMRDVSADVEEWLVR